jgi:hypothetical protein
MDERVRRRFASRTIPGHLLRGVIGALAVVAAVMVAGGSVGRLPPLAALPLAGVALWMFRGCPTCWAIGLVETASCRGPGRIRGG